MEHTDSKSSRHPAWLRACAAAGACLSLVVGARSQNLVPNPSFEVVSPCPGNTLPVTNAAPWSQPTDGTTDAYNACSTSPAFSGVPNNLMGVQAARTGNGYAGLAPYNQPFPNYREYLEAPLNSPLIAGHVYEVAFWYSFAENAQYSCDSLGLALSVGTVGPILGWAPLTLTPVATTVPGTRLNDRTNWQRVRGVLVAAGGEDHVLIGNFNNDAGTTIWTEPGTKAWSYYYIDDVLVREVDPVCACGSPSWSDDFDLYGTGGGIDGFNSWDPACGHAVSLASATHAVSLPNSAAIKGQSDLVNTLHGYTSGAWTFRVMQYLPGPTASDALTESTWLRLLHEHFFPCFPFLGQHPSVEMEFDPSASVWKLYQGCTVAASGPIHYDQWVEIRAEIDLDNDTVEVFYAGTSTAPPASWYSSAACPGPSGQHEIQAVKLTSYGVDPNSTAYYDCMALTPKTPTVDVTVDWNSSASKLEVVPASAVVAPDDIVRGVLPNALAHTCDAGSKVASHLLVTFDEAANPALGSAATMSDIAPLGGADTLHYLTMKSTLSGSYTYEADILDQNYEFLCAIDPELVTYTPVVTYCTSKIDSVGCVPVIGSTGAPSPTWPSGFVIRATNVINNKAGLLFYGYASAAIPFQGGILCVHPPIRRTPVQNSGGSPPPNDCSGVLAFDFNAYIAAGINPSLTSGVSVYAQYWYRDPGSASSVGLTDAIMFTVP